ncbi:NAD(P)-binding domain protein [Niveomyces insectorum RCEF 264]|uniref:NAD(P)-binding domain protein n=1 Tax=Niveomyces insectorum RCEF 264 TaxID=1081102 RepID=A0A167Z976_9HYPO|nr:NAD(P)-binding domain protein [Niveomyces insectorum RCEF 264]
MAANGTNGTNGANGTAAASPAAEDNYPSTMPLPGHNYQVSLSGKVIAITGANQGIGLGIAEVCFANDAAFVYSLDISAPGEPFQALAKRYPGRFQYLETDVTAEASVTAALDRVYADRGRFDGFVSNAGATKHQPALAFSLDEVERLFRLNVFGAWIGATAAARKFIATRTRGSIVFTASMTSYRPNRAAPSAPYGATKAAVRNMTHTLAMEWAAHGIRVNCVSPGFIKTALTYYVETSPDWDTKMQYYGGMPRLALPQELGGAYVYLLSDTATYTTGIDIPIAGVVGAW